MALTCTAQSLEAAANCFECLTPKQAQSVQTYLLAQMALQTGAILDASPSGLLTAAKCFDCLTVKQREIVVLYLLCQLVNK